MRVEPRYPVPGEDISFKWRINQQVTKYGNSMMKATEYYPNNGLKLVVVDSFRDGKQVAKTKELYDKSWRLLKSKFINYVNGKKEKSYYIA